MEHRLPLLTTCPAYLSALLAACWSVYIFEQAPKKFTCVCARVCVYVGVSAVGKRNKARECVSSRCEHAFE